MLQANQNQSEAGGVPTGLLADPQFLTELREKMLSFARLQLGDEAQAEDAVQEAFAGALAGAKDFERRSAVQTWVFAILKNKIADILRRGSRFVDADALVGENAAGETFDQLFDKHGHWHADSKPKAWRKPNEVLDDQQFWGVFDTCLENLPAQHARLFMMREMLDLETPEIIEATGVSQSNLNVSLYRARVRLRECLNITWFSKEGEAG